jgi:hypothetical protein
MHQQLHVEQAEPRCHCGHRLSFRFMSLEVSGDRLSSVQCYCSRCDERALRDGDALAVHGNGVSMAAAYADRERTLEEF